MLKTLTALLFLITLGFISVSSYAQVTTKHEHKGKEYYRELEGSLLNEYSEIIDDIEDWGLSPNLHFYTTVMGNPSGGLKKGAEYAGLMDLFLDFDLEKIFGIKNTKLVVGGAWASGRSLSDEKIGNFFQVDNVFSGQGVVLYNLFLESHFLDEKINIAVGRLAVGDEFASSTIYYNYVSDAIDGNPISLSLNDAAFFANPEAAWGVRTILEPSEQFQIMAGAYNSNPEVGDIDEHGVDFSFKEGAILISQLSYTIHNDSSHQGLPGAYMIGGFYDTRDFELLKDSEKKREGNYGFYGHVEQMVYREKKDRDEGLTPWSTVTYFPEEEVSRFPFFIDGGAVYEGLIESRNYDRAAVGFAYGTLSDDLKGKDYELMFELTYIIQLAKWMEIQPDIQYVIHPVGSSEIPDAFVLGVELALDLF